MVLEVIKCGNCDWSGIPEEVSYIEEPDTVICPKCLVSLTYKLSDVKEAITARRGKVKLDPKYSIDKPL